MSKRNLIEKKVDMLEDIIRKKTEAGSNFAEVEHQVRLLVRIFRYYDADNTGIVTFKDFFAVMTKSNFVGVQREVENLFNRYDEDNTGRLDYLEFCKTIFGKGRRGKLSQAQLDVIGKIRIGVLRKHGITGLLALRTLRNFQYENYDRQNFIDGQMFVNIVRKHVFLNNREVDVLFNAEGKINLDQFFAEVAKGMALDRKQLVSSVFRRMDTQSRGYVTVEDIERAYRSVPHAPPSGVSGQLNTTGDNLQQFLFHLTDESNPRPGSKIDWKPFLDYYRCISAAVEHDEDFDIILRGSWYFEPGSYVGRTSLARGSSPLRGSPSLPGLNSRGSGSGNDGEASPLFINNNNSRPASSGGLISTMHQDFCYKPRPVSSGRVGNIMDGNFNCTRSKASYRDGHNGYSRDNLSNGPSDYISPRYEKKYSSRDQPPLSITATDFHYTGPLKTNDSRYLATVGGRSPVLSAFNDEGYLVGNTVYPTLTGFPGSPDLKDQRTTTERDFPSHAPVIAASRQHNGVYSRPTTGLRKTQNTGGTFNGTFTSTNGGGGDSWGFSRPSSRAENRTLRDGPYSSAHGYAVTDSPTTRRVLVIHTDGTEETVDLVDELGTTRFDTQYLLTKLTELGIVDISDIRL